MSATAPQAARLQPTRAAERWIRVWDLPLRLFHWLLVVAVAIAFLSADEDSPINQWHVLAGWVAGVLIIFRLVWGFVGGEHSRFVDFVRPSRIGEHLSGLVRGRAEPSLGHNPLGGLSVLILLALVAATVWTGAFAGEAAEDLHQLIAWTLLGFVVVHVAAVVIMSLVQRENLVAAMITGKKPAAEDIAPRDARRHGAVGVAIAMLVLAGTVYGILRYDPQAFTLRSAASFEQGAGGAAGANEHGERDLD